MDAIDAYIDSKLYCDKAPCDKAREDVSLAKAKIANELDNIISNKIEEHAMEYDHKFFNPYE